MHIFGAVFFSDKSINEALEEMNSYDSFTECLSEKGFVMYGSQYCGFCTKQKELFGDSFELVNYVECTEQQDLCVEKGIEGVPA